MLKKLVDPLNHVGFEMFTHINQLVFGERHEKGLLPEFSWDPKFVERLYSIHAPACTSVNM